jgi:hypothetical protein
MSDERVETLVYRICWDRLGLHTLQSAVTDTLTDDVLTADWVDEEMRQVWGDAEQVAILRSIYAALSAAPVDIAQVREIDDIAGRADRGPHFFNLVLIMYFAWSHRWREANGHADAQAVPVFCIDHT